MFDCLIPDIEPKKGYGLIYCYTLEDGRQYIGQTTQQLKNRHIGHLRSQLFFDKCLKKSKFHLFIIGEYPEGQLNEKELYNIGLFETIYPQGFNRQTILDSPINRKPKNKKPIVLKEWDDKRSAKFDKMVQKKYYGSRLWYLYGEQIKQKLRR